MSKFLTAKNDAVFKAIFCDEDEPFLLTKLLEDILQIKINSLEKLDNELKISFVKEKSKRVDCVVKINGNLYIHLEVNSAYSEKVAFRNFLFFSHIIISKILRGKDYNTKDNFLHISLTYKMSKKRKALKILKIAKNVKMYEYNMDKILDYWYNKNTRKVEKYKYLIMQDLQPEELEKLIKQRKDEVIMTYFEKLKKLNRGDKFELLMTAEEEEIFWQNTYREEGREEGIKEGIKEGRKENAKSIAKNMLREGVDVSLISRCTNLSVENILALR